MASEGPNSPATAVDDAGVGTIAWTNPGNVLASDDVRATVALALNEISHYVKVTDFGFAIPAGATIDGVIAEIERQANAATGIRDEEVKLVKGGTISGDNKADQATAWPQNTDAYRSYGGAADLWGLTWSDTDINATTFGVALACKNYDVPSRTGRVDHVRMTVHYTAAGGGGQPRRSMHQTRIRRIQNG